MKLPLNWKSAQDRRAHSDNIQSRPDESIGQFGLLFSPAGGVDDKYDIFPTHLFRHIAAEAATYYNKISMTLRQNGLPFSGAYIPVCDYNISLRTMQTGNRATRKNHPLSEIPVRN